MNYGALTVQGHLRMEAEEVVSPLRTDDRGIEMAARNRKMFERHRCMRLERPQRLQNDYHEARLTAHRRMS